ncbi:MAG: AMP-binding enzyme, partial [Betaproteobacteria bacterium]
MKPAQMQRAIRAHPGVFDCAVVSRDGGNGRSYVIAYVVPRGPLSIARLRDDLAAQLGRRALPEAFAQVPTIPLDAKGEPDTAALMALPSPDAALLSSARDAAVSTLRARRAAAVARWAVTRPPPLHLSDVVAGWKRFAESPAGRSAEKSVEAKARASGPLAISSGGTLDVPDGAPRWLGDLLSRAAQRMAPAGMLFHDAEGVETFVTYGELQARARSLLGSLLAAGFEAGSNVVLHLRGNREFFEAFWACVLGRMVPVPTPVAASYAEPTGNVRRLGDACSMLGKPFVLTNASLESEV